ncbi:U3 small nucleolar RNA-associated protein 18 [Dinochytrium kinnereticum]|nr:U3 small nucleolar RNA-associated protein 18 [Dinochytrium kinnereticum]
MGSKKTPSAGAAAKRSRIDARASERDDEERALEAMVFGAAVQDDSIWDSLDSVPDRIDLDELERKMDNEDADILDEELFVIDKRKTRIFENLDGERRFLGDDSEDAAEKEGNLSDEDEKCVWKDDDEDSFTVNIADGPNRLRKLRTDEAESTISSIEYERRLRRQFEKLHPTPAWAKPNLKRSHDENDRTEATFTAAAVFRSSLGLIRQSTNRTLPKTIIDAHRVRDGNQMEPSSAVVQSCQFHPAAPILMTAGLDHTLRLFHIDGQLNPKVQSVYFKDLPILAADFTSDGRQIIASGRRKHFYVYDIDKGMVERIYGIRGRDEESFERHVASPCGQFIAFLGRNGYIVLVSRMTKQWVANLKMNGSVRAIEFSKDGKYLYSIGDQAQES